MPKPIPAPAMPEDRLLSTNEAAKLLRMHPQTFRKYFKEHPDKLPTVRLGRSYRFSLHDLLKVVEAHKGSLADSPSVPGGSRNGAA